MSDLITTPNLPDCDSYYQELLELHNDQSKQNSDAINAKLILILSNHIGDRDILRQAFALAKSDTASPSR